MTDPEWLLLVSLSDPESSGPAASDLARVRVGAIMHAISAHGAEPVAFRKLLPLKGQAGAALDTWLEEAETRQMWANAYAMQLGFERERVSVAMTAAGVEHVAVKGPVFAAEIYDQPSDRPFTDIDMLVGLESFGAMAPVMQSLGFALAHRSDRDRSGRYLEQKWQCGQPLRLIEVHGDLVHYPGLRKHLKFGLAEYRISSGDGQFPMAAHFMTAIVHASCGHKFHDLHFITDILQAFRKLGSADLAHLATVSGKLRAGPEIRAGLSLLAQIYRPKGIDAALDLFKVGGFAAFPVSASSIRNAPARTWPSRIAHNAFRIRQHIVSRS